VEDITKINCNVSFNSGARIEVNDDHSPIYLVEFYEWFGDDWALIYTDHNFKPYHWFSHSKKFRTKWLIKVWGYDDGFPVLLFQHTYNESGKNILLRFDYPSIKIHKVWLDKAVSFRNETNSYLFVETKYSEQLKSEYPDIVLVNKIDNEKEFISVNKIYATYSIARHEIQHSAFDWWESGEIFENHAHHYKSFEHPVDWIKLPNEKLIDSILQL
jgi:hypothetical protein